MLHSGWIVIVRHLGMRMHATSDDSGYQKNRSARERRVRRSPVDNRDARPHIPRTVTG